MEWWVVKTWLSVKHVETSTVRPYNFKVKTSLHVKGIFLYMTFEDLKAKRVTANYVTISFPRTSFCVLLIWGLRARIPQSVRRLSTRWVTEQYRQSYERQEMTTNSTRPTHGRTDVKFCVDEIPISGSGKPNHGVIIIIIGVEEISLLNLTTLSL